MSAAGVLGVLLDIEGTTSSVAFVYEVLFPFARRGLADFLRRRWGEPDVAAACERIARDTGAPSLSAWTGPETAQERVGAEAIRLMDADVKATGLKELQGLIWQEGYTAGRLLSHVYPDVPPALRNDATLWSGCLSGAYREDIDIVAARWVGCQKGADGVVHTVGSAARGRICGCNPEQRLGDGR